MKEHISITIDSETKEKIDFYAEERKINRSATIRLIVNEYLMNRGAPIE